MRKLGFSFPFSFNCFCFLYCSLCAIYFVLLWKFGVVVWGFWGEEGWWLLGWVLGVWCVCVHTCMCGGGGGGGGGVKFISFVCATVSMIIEQRCVAAAVFMLAVLVVFFITFGWNCLLAMSLKCRFSEWYFQ